MVDLCSKENSRLDVSPGSVAFAITMLGLIDFNMFTSVSPLKFKVPTVIGIPMF